MRLFLDANVLFTAAHNPEGKAAFIISHGRVDTWDIFTSAFAVEESERNLAAKYPGSERRLLPLLKSITVIGEHPDAPCPDILNERDRAIFRAAFACNATYLLTGDIDHFGPLMNKPTKTSGINILTPAQFLSSLLSK
jgi:predicted nucleic acid-binding protein